MYLSETYCDKSVEATQQWAAIWCRLAFDSLRPFQAHYLDHFTTLLWILHFKCILEQLKAILWLFAAPSSLQIYKTFRPFSISFNVASELQYCTYCSVKLCFFCITIFAFDLSLKIIHFFPCQFYSLNRLYNLYVVLYLVFPSTFQTDLDRLLYHFAHSSITHS